MRSPLSLVWRNLTAHPLRSALTALAITLGVGMVLAASIVGQAASTSASALSAQGPRVDLEVFARAGTPFDQAVLDTLRAYPAAEQVSPSLRVEAQGVDPPIPSLTLRGVDPPIYQHLHQPPLAGGTFLDQPDSIVLPMMVTLDHGLHVGDEITLRVGQRTGTLTVGGRLRLAQDVAALAGSTTAYVPLSAAQALAGLPGQINHVEVALRLGADLDQALAGLAAQLGPGLAVARAVTGGGVALTDSLVRLGLAMVGAIMLFAAAFVIMNTFAMSVTARTQEIGALRALGMTRGCKPCGVMRMVLAEAALMGLAGAALGVLAGIALAWGAMWALGTLDSAAFAVPWWGVALSVTLGLMVTLVGALQPARRAGRVSPLAAMRSQHVHARAESGWYVRHGWRVGVLVLAVLLPALVTIALLLRPDFYLAMALTAIGQAGLLAAVVLLLPALVNPLARVARPALLRWLGTAGRLAADNLGRNKLRAVMTAGALTAVLTVIIATSGLLPLLLKGGLTGFLGLLNEDGMVGPDVAALITSGEWSLDNAYQKMSHMPLDPRVLQALEPLAATGVIEIEHIAFAPVPPALTALPGSPGTFVDPEIFLRIGNFDFFAGDPANALEWMQRGRAVLLGPIPAERLDASVGDVIPIQTPHGEVEFTVAGIGGSGTGFPVFPFADGETYFDVTGTTWVGIIVPTGQDRDAALAQVEAAVEALEGADAGMMNLDTLAATFFEIFERLQALLNALLLLAVVVASLGVVNTMVANVAERRHEIALLRAVGATQRQVRQAIVAEAALLGLLAAIIATVVSVAFLVLFALVMTPGGTPSLGFRVSWELAASVLPIGLRGLCTAASLSLVLGPLAAALAAYYPARQAAALDVVEATRSERVALRRTSPSGRSARRPEGRRKMTRSLTWTMAWRNLEQSRLRTVLSALAVALGVAMTVAADVTSGAIMNALSESEDAQKFMTGLLDQLGSILTLVGVGITLAAGFLVFNAFAMSVTHRRRQIGALRSLGMTRRQVMRLVLVEALIIGAAGTIVGLIAGPLLGRGSIAVMKALLGEGLFVFTASSAPTSSLLLATALGVGITVLAVLIPARQATLISPLVALREEGAAGLTRTPAGRAWAGLLIALALAVYLAVAPPGEWIEPPWDITLTISFVLLWLGCLALILSALIGGVGHWARLVLTRFWGATGRLVADNLRRGRGRVMMTILTLALALTMIASMTGFISFMMELMGPSLKRIDQLRAWVIAPFDISAGMSAYSGLDTLKLPSDLTAEIHQVVEGRARVMDQWRFAIVPELSFFGSSYFSFVTDPHDVEQSADVFFAFIEGDWETAMPIMEAGCGVLLTPLVASKNNVSLGDEFEITGTAGPLPCTVAGIGRTFVNASIISLAAGDELAVTEPFMIFVVPKPHVDRAELKMDLTALLERYSNAHLIESEGMYEAQFRVMEALPGILNAFLLLAIVAAALGTVNTTMMSVAERQRELGLLRAVGATRRQVSAVVVGEAALMGLIGGFVGLIAGAGVVVLLAVVYGGNAWGVPDLDLWGAAFRSVQPALFNGLLGLVAAPLISAGAAWVPVRSILRGSAIETMQPERQERVPPRRAAAGFLSRGSIRTRFVLGTAALVAIVLAGLVAVVTTHARVRIEEQMRDVLRTMVTWNAGMVELALPDGAQTLDLEMLQTGQTFGFDSGAMLRFESLMDDLTANGLLDLTIADRDNVVLIGLDTRQIGTLAPELEVTDRAHVYSEHAPSSPLAAGAEGDWLMHATAPIRNDAGLVVGSLRLTVSARQIQDFLGRLRNALVAIGIGFGFVGLVISWALSTPLVRATRQLATHAAGVGRGELALYGYPTRRRIGAHISLRARLTVALVLILALLVGVLELVAIPIERRYVEATLKDSLVTAAGWIGQAASESFGVALSDLSPAGYPTFEQLLSIRETLDLARLQALADQMRSDDLAYIALVNEQGRIALSDQLALIGEQAPLPSDTRIEETTWRGESVWVASTPLRRGREGERIGALRMAGLRTRVEAFLGEGRNLFRLTGLIAVLAGVLLAQAIGGAVTAPVRQLAAGTRRIAQGDLGVHFDLDTQDELALLANAYNQMVVGLREREWLRDVFGRFVSHEVAEAIRTGKVRLEGENRIVSVLFCDIRDFTARSERNTPEQVVALLNEYLPVVVNAAQHHAGTVNKFGGDSTLVIYGAPNLLQESAYQAVLTALEMRADLDRLNERLVERGEAPIHVGVGINTGVALAGAVGPPERQEYTVIGDTVNLASRIEALNKTYPDHDVLISGWTYEALGSRRAEFQFADLGEVEIRGKAAPVRVWAVIDKT